MMVNDEAMLDAALEAWLARKGVSELMALVLLLRAPQERRDGLSSLAAAISHSGLGGEPPLRGRSDRKGHPRRKR